MITAQNFIDKGLLVGAENGDVSKLKSRIKSLDQTLA